MVFYYNTQRPLSYNFLILAGTASKIVLKSVEFYVYICVQATLNVLVCMEIIRIPKPGQMGMNTVTLSTSLQVWLVVFFAKNCYDRYQQLYDGCMAFDEAVKIFIQQTTIVCPYVSLRPGLHLASKYMVASVLLFYFGVTGGKVSDNEWDFIRGKGLLDEDELAYLKIFPGHKGLLLSSWTMRVIDQMIRTPEMKATFEPPEMAWVFHRLQVHNQKVAMKMRFVADLLAMPIPFAYFHLLNVLLFLNFIVVGYAVSCASSSIFATVPYGVFVFVFMALRNLSASMADPFRDQGADDLHLAFPLVSFTNYNFDHSAILVSSVDSYWWDQQIETKKDGHKPGQTPSLSSSGWFTTAQVDIRPTHEQIYDGDDPPDDPDAGCQHKLRGDQVFVAYKWDPDGRISSNHADSYSVKWLRHAFAQTLGTIEEHLGIKPKEPPKPQLRSQSSAVGTSSHSMKMKAPAGICGAGVGGQHLAAAGTPSSTE